MTTPTERPDWSFHQQTWNTLASEQGLPKIQSMSEGRKAKLRARLRDCPDFWPQVAEQLRSRGLWAREHSFPSFDQILQKETFDKLLEGNYGPKPSDETSKPSAAFGRVSSLNDPGRFDAIDR